MNKIRTTVKKAVAIALSLTVIIGVMLPATVFSASAAGEKANDFVINTDSVKIPISYYDADGKLIINDGVKINEMNLSSIGIRGATFADKVLFNSQDNYFDTADEYVQSTYMFNGNSNINDKIGNQDRHLVEYPMPAAEAAAMNYADAGLQNADGSVTVRDVSRDTAKKPNEEGVFVEYTLYDLQTYAVNADGRVHVKTLYKVKRKVSDYYLKPDNTYADRNNSVATAYSYIDVSSSDYYIAPSDAEYQSLTISNGKVTHVGAVKTRNYVTEIPRSTVESNPAYGAAASGEKAGVYTGGNIPGGIFNTTTHLDQAWIATGSGIRECTGAYIDLGAYYVITDVATFGLSGNNDITFQIGDPGNWQTLFVNRGGNYHTSFLTHTADISQLQTRVPSEYLSTNDAKYKNATRYIRVESNGGNTSEMVLYGYKAGELTTYDTGRSGASQYLEYSATDFNTYDPKTSTYNVGTLSKYIDTESAYYDPDYYLEYVMANKKDISNVNTAGQAMGTNIIHVNETQNMHSMGNVRQYVQNFSIIDQFGNNSYRYYTGGFNLDSYWAKINEFGDVQNSPCLQFSSKWFANTPLYTGYDQSRNWIPIETFITGTTTETSGRISATDGNVQIGVNKESALSYGRHSNYLYNFVAHYGSNKDIDMDTVSLRENIVTNSYNDRGVHNEADGYEVGLGYVSVVENSNEQNKNWAGNMAYLSPLAYAAMCSANYDGHESTIFTDTDGNSYEIVKGDGVTYLKLQDVPVGTLNGYELTLFAGILPVRVTTYTDVNLNTYEVYSDLSAKINGITVGTFAPNADDDGATGILTRNGYKYYPGENNNTATSKVDLSNKKTRLKLQAADKVIGNFDDSNLDVVYNNAPVGVAYDVYIQHNYEKSQSYKYYVNPTTREAYYYNFNLKIGTLSNDGQTINLDYADLATTEYFPVEFASQKTTTGSVSVIKTEEISHRETAETIAAQSIIPTIKLDVKPTGVKNADKKMMLATGGFLEGTLIRYMEQMKDWFNYNRTDGYFAVDVVNFHQYYNASAMEDDEEAFELYNEIVDWSQLHVPGRELWLSEYDTDSYDFNLKETLEVRTDNGDGTYSYSLSNDDVRNVQFTFSSANPETAREIYEGESDKGIHYRVTYSGGTLYKKYGKVVRADSNSKWEDPYIATNIAQHDNATYQVTKAQRLARASIILQSKGVGRMTMFELYDSSTGVYSNSGLTTPLEGKKLEWYHFSTMRNVLDKVWFKSENIQPVSVRFVDRVKDDTVAWSPSRNKTLVGQTGPYAQMTELYRNNYVLDPSGEKKINLYTYRFEGSGEVIYAVWLASSEQAHIDNFEFSVADSGLTDYHITLIEGEYGVDEGKKTALQETDGKVTFNLSEGIAYIKLTNNNYNGEVVSNYDRYDSQKLEPVQLQLGDYSFSKPLGAYDGTEIVDMFYNDNGEKKKNQFYSNTELVNIAKGQNKSEELITEINRYKQSATTILTDKVIDAAMTKAMTEQNKGIITGIFSIEQELYTIIYEGGLASWRPWQKEAAYQFYTELSAATALLRVLEAKINDQTLTVAQAREMGKDIVLATVATDAGYNAIFSANVSKISPQATKVRAELNKIPIVNVMALVYINEELQKLSDAITAINESKTILNEKNETEAVAYKTSVNQLIQKHAAIAAYGGTAIDITKQRLSGTAPVDVTNAPINIRAAASYLTTSSGYSAAAAKATSNAVVHSNVANLMLSLGTYSYGTSLNSQIGHAKTQMDKALIVNSTDADKILVSGSAAVYALVNVGYALGHSFAAVAQLSTGIYYDETSTTLSGEGNGVSIINDELLAKFSKLLDEEVYNAPKFYGDIQRWYRPVGIGSEHTQVPQSTTGLVAKYQPLDEYGTEGYDIYATFDDFYYIDSAMLYYVAGANTSIKVYDASEGGTGALLFSYEFASGLTDWHRISNETGMSYASSGSFTEESKTTKTNKVLIVWGNGGNIQGELCMYGKKANSTVGNTVEPVPGTLNTERDRRITVTLDYCRTDVANGAISGIVISNDVQETTLELNSKTLPIHENIVITDPITGLATTYVFSGWYTDKTYTTPFTTQSIVTDHTTIYAKWTEVAPFQQIVLNPGMLSTTSGINAANLGKICDQQDVSISTIYTDYIASAFGSPNPFYIDLGAINVIEQISYLSGTGTASAKIWISVDNENWTQVHEKLNMSYRTIANEYLTSSYTGTNYYARYLKVEYTGGLCEMYLYGGVPETFDDVTVTFQTNDSSVSLCPELIQFSSLYTPPEIYSPNKTFAGWYSNEDLTVKYTNKIPLYSNTTLYAKWIEGPSYTLSYMSQGQIYETVEFVQPSDTISTITPTAPSGLAFEGWYTDLACTTAFTATTITQDTILYAKWTTAADNILSLNSTNIISMNGSNNKDTWPVKTDADLNKYVDIARGVFSASQLAAYISTGTANAYLDAQTTAFTSMIIDLGVNAIIPKIIITLGWNGTAADIQINTGSSLENMMPAVTVNLPKTGSTLVVANMPQGTQGRYLEIVQTRNYNIRDIAAYASPLATLTATAENGTISGNQDIYAIGSIATVSTAPASSDYIFKGWYMNGTVVSMDTELSIALFGDTTVNAVYAHVNAPSFETSSERLYTSETMPLSVQSTEIGGAENKTWSSSNADVVTVTSRGIIKAVAPGSAEIAVETTYGKAKINVFVTGNQAIGVKIAGAQIKVTSSVEQSLRFGTYTTNRNIESNYTNVQYGMILLPTSMLGSNGTHANDFFIGENKSINVAAQIKGISGTGYIYNIVLNGFSPENSMRYDTEITARAYVSYTDTNNKRKTVYSEPMSRSVYAVAQNYCNGIQAEGRTDWTREEALAYIIEKS